ncbi:hypothetical protein V2I01_40265 [Micromonospora sp. BRA006-A]|nr:hypothetical protein [Micromonospora sp. BRA006-A]
MTIPDTGARVEPGSFRDPGNRVFHRGDEVLRGLDERSARTGGRCPSPTSSGRPPAAGRSSAPRS